MACSRHYLGGYPLGGEGLDDVARFDIGEIPKS
jgi:hypothetical protein